jgi:hypothetical protein
MSVSPSKGLSRPSGPAALSKRRSEVEPTATTRPPFARAPSIASAAAAVKTPVSACILCSSAASVLTGRNVPAPTCKVTAMRRMPRASSAASMASVKCNPAVGAATAPSFRAKTVW